MSTSVHRIFGLSLSSPVRLPAATEDAPGRPDIELELVGEHELNERISPGGALVFEDGAGLSALRGERGDFAFLLDGRPAYHLDGRTLTGLDPRGEPALLRALLDSVLGTASLLHGHEALHAAAVARPGGAIALAGERGAGKSTLAAALVEAGAVLVADDVLVGEPCAEGVQVHPGPAALVLDGVPVEVRGAGPGPLPLCAVVLVSAHGEPALRALERTAAALLPLTLDTGRERLRARFELASEIAARVPLLELNGARAAEPGQLAALVLRELEPAGAAS